MHKMAFRHSGRVMRDGHIIDDPSIEWFVGISPVWQQAICPPDGRNRLDIVPFLKDGVVAVAQASRVRLVGIQVQLKAIIGRHANQDVPEQ
jgi:hypothetical protein